MKMIIIGGGAAGLVAAISAARSLKASGRDGEVLVLEGGQKAGKKLLSTGNGHCNLTNLKENAACWHSDVPALTGELLGRFGAKETQEFFDSLGIPCVSKEGYVYPKCREAAAVREALVAECEALGVRLLYGRKAEQLLSGAASGGSAFTVIAGEERFSADRLILAAGGMAFPKSGSDGSGYQLAMDAGHSVIQPLPALVALTAAESYTRQLAGVRVEAAATLTVNGIKRRTEEGEIQLTDYGISGIPIFQLSGDAVEALCGEKEVKVFLNLWEGRSEPDILYLLKQRVKARPEQETGELLRGVVPDKMIPVLLNASGIPLHVPTGGLAPALLNRLSREMAGLCFTVNGAKDFDSAQVTRGGVPLAEVDRSLQSRKTPGLYFAGEILNVDGLCGGYNLQWAWASGYLAGQAAVRA